MNIDQLLQKIMSQVQSTNVSQNNIIQNAVKMNKEGNVNGIEQLFQNYCSTNHITQQQLDMAKQIANKFFGK